MPQHLIHKLGLEDPGFLQFTQENWKLHLESQLVCVIPLGKLQKIWPVIWREAIFPLFFICSVHLDIVWGRSYSHHVRFYNFMFMHKISTQEVSQCLFEFIVYSGLLFLKKVFAMHTVTRKSFKQLWGLSHKKFGHKKNINSFAELLFHKGNLPLE